jgi:hypothetical protein
MSVSFGLEGGVGVDGRDDGLDGVASVGDELPAGAACGGGEGCGPDVLVDEHAGGAARVHRGCEVIDVLSSAISPVKLAVSAGNSMVR